ncbi:hypothetical protein GWR56_14060 [Mucilaginibacter sp. 14171R-50]|uniref:transaldolase family protein n=1 Tax=Mucilaginibacter sp. 14171R-50 TaxID=2703789 RepID=UPI00138BA0B3|nr:transaldolase family protein [Mucilaginibacter sp. 14171R-50]QHS56613.1 hypothetical protein GWR56_14060 [Mucilaginibacter sp. 14171R-50]
MKSNKVKDITRLDQRIWLDFFERRILNNGELESMMAEYALTGVTSNPSIFEKAISSNTDYDADIAKFSIP